MVAVSFLESVLCIGATTGHALTLTICSLARKQRTFGICAGKVESGGS